MYPFYSCHKAISEYQVIQMKERRKHSKIIRSHKLTDIDFSSKQSHDVFDVINLTEAVLHK